MEYINVLVNRYGGDMLEINYGDKESMRKLLAKKMWDSLHDMAEDAVSGEVHYDREKGTGSVKYVREKKFEPAVLHSDEYEIVEVPMPEHHSDYLLVLGTEGMVAEAVLFCPDNIKPMDFIRKKAKEQGQKIKDSGIRWATVLDHEGREHLWYFFAI